MCIGTLLNPEVMEVQGREVGLKERGEGGGGGMCLCMCAWASVKLCMFLCVSVHHHYVHHFAILPSLHVYFRNNYSMIMFTPFGLLQYACTSALAHV